MVLERYSRKLEIAKGEKRDPYNLIILQGPLYDIYTDSVKVNPVYYCFRLRIKNNNNKKVRIPVVAIVVDVVIFFISFHSFMFYYFMYFYNYFFFSIRDRTARYTWYNPTEYYYLYLRDYTVRMVDKKLYKYLYVGFEILKNKIPSSVLRKNVRIRCKNIV